MRISLIILLVAMTAACKSAPERPEAPAWIQNPEDGAVGSAVTHVKGRHHQEEMAIARARERLAARYGVNVSSVQAIQERVVNDRAYLTSDKVIRQEVKTQTVKAQVRETWYDPSKDEIWVWLYPVE